uniref:uncharacterized protein LOC104265751 isoform X2 n=1 Tax=Ciona intestinalis TaxID=7719 RepID=UPI00052158D2|nr:uncharacterized protein LOC104265751 isoform X2 [Ciona intestinalis]|eukprot:XP_026690269.1 uncharacterized protein LOC104265751 isoform X2 [Ciona intestinalis]
MSVDSRKTRFGDIISICSGSTSLENDQGWKVNLRSKIENDLSYQVQEALAPIVSSHKKWAAKKKTERRKALKLQVNYLQQRRSFQQLSADPNDARFKYIDVNYIPQADQVYSGNSKGNFPASIANLRLLKTGARSRAYGSDRHTNSMCGGLDLSLLDHSSSNLFSISRRGFPGSTLKPLIPKVGEYTGIALPSYGINRQCFQVYTKEGMNSLLNSKSRRSKLTQLGDGKYLNKHGIALSRIGPFWPNGFGPVCPCPEFILSCPKDEMYGESFIKPKLPENRATSEDESIMSPRSTTAPYTKHTNGLSKPMWHGKPVVYDSERSSRSPPPHSVPDGMPESLVFESRFESGNLRQARRTGELEYELVLKTDMYTNRHTQWYYFKVQQAKPNCTYKFSIINFLKKDSLYNYGMKPLLYSEHLAKEKGIGWHRGGKNISYTYCANTRNTILSLDLQYYCLKFEVSFDWAECEDDTIYFAHCYPYTYSDLLRHIDEIMACPNSSKHVKREVLCETDAGNTCFLLTVTHFPDKEKDKYKDLHQSKQGIILTARVHPGESQSSWMMKGVLDFLTSDNNTADQLRKKFIFKIVPMLNPDGVIVGNYRTSLAARDLNRNYRHPKQSYFPTIWHTKEMVDQFNKDHPILFYCDLHGHSRKHKVFMYGCERKALKPKQTENIEGNKDGKPAPPKKHEEYKAAIDFVEERLFPWLMFQCLPNRFSFHDTKYAVRRSKESTGRVVMFRQMGIANSFTLEATFAGTIAGSRIGRHFNISDFQLIGRKLCECILEYSNVFDNPVKKSKVILQMTTEIMKKQKLQTSSNNQTTSVERKDQSKHNVEKKIPTLQNKEGKCFPNTLSINDGGKPEKIELIEDNKSNTLPVTSQLVAQNNPKVFETIVQNQINAETASQTAIRNNNAFNKDNCDVTIQLSQREALEPKVGEDQEDINEDDTLDYSCLDAIRNFNMSDLASESETSSDSDSESEPEVPYEAPTSKKKLDNEHYSSTSRKKKKKKQKNGKSVSAPTSTSKSKYKNTEQILVKESLKQKPRFPAFVSKYSNRSNGGIPIFAQERIKERAARRLAELNVAKEDKQQQQEQLAEQWAEIQNFPRLPTNLYTGNRDTVMCNVKYTMDDQPRRLHYMLCNPYSNPPSTGDANVGSSDHKRVVKYSPTHQYISKDDLALKQMDEETEDEVYAFNNIDSPPTNDLNISLMNRQNKCASNKSTRGSSSSHSSHNSESTNSTSHEHFRDSSGSQEKFLPRTVVLPVQNLSFKLFKKHGDRKTPSFTVPASRQQHFVENGELITNGKVNNSIGSAYQISDLSLPPSMKAGDVMTVHMHYPGQVHPVEPKPSYRFKTSPRGPPMIFGEPAVMNQKAHENYFPNKTER